jgi:hypothetical protein
MGPFDELVVEIQLSGSFELAAAVVVVAGELQFYRMTLSELV